MLKLYLSTNVNEIKYISNYSYIAWSGEFELAGGEDRGEETPLQKYQRLNCEVKELIETLENLKTSGDDKAGDSKAKQEKQQV